MTEPTDAEIVAFAIETGMRVRTGGGAVSFARAVLAKWCAAPAEQPAPSAAAAEQQAGATKEHLRLVRVIADKIEDGTLFQSGIYSNKDLARFVRNVADAAAPQPSPTPQADSQPVILHQEAARVMLKEMDMNDRVLAAIDAETVNQADSQPAPVLWVSPEQFANFVDADEAPFGTYLPARKTSAGKFTMPLFAARAPADSMTAPAGGIPGNFITHRASWRKALETVKAHAAGDDVAYWDHELRAFDRSFDRLWALMRDTTPPAQAADSVLEDAARYQWIRGPVEESTRYSRWRIEYWDGPNGWQPMQRERMDSAIDSARKQGGSHD